MGLWKLYFVALSYNVQHVFHFKMYYYCIIPYDNLLNFTAIFSKLPFWPVEWTVYVWRLRAPFGHLHIFHFISEQFEIQNKELQCVVKSLTKKFPTPSNYYYSPHFGGRKAEEKCRHIHGSLNHSTIPYSCLNKTWKLA